MGYMIRTGRNGLEIYSVPKNHRFAMTWEQAVTEVQNWRIRVNKFNDYQDWSESTAIYPQEVAMSYLVTGLTAEAGEVSGKYAKYLRDNTSTLELEEALIKELGDVLWFVARLSSELGYSLEYVAKQNMIKLNDRKVRDKIGGSGDER